MNDDDKINKEDSIITENQENLNVNVNTVVSPKKMQCIDKDTLDAINIVVSLSNMKFVFDEETMELVTETLDPGCILYQGPVESVDSTEESTPFKTIKVRPYCAERNIYLELEHNLLILDTGDQQIVIGFLLNDEIVPLTEELKMIIARDYDGLTICDS